MILIRKLLYKDDFDSFSFIQMFLSFIFASAVKMSYTALIFNLFLMSSHCEFDALLSQ